MSSGLSKQGMGTGMPHPALSSPSHARGYATSWRLVLGLAAILYLPACGLLPKIGPDYRGADAQAQAQWQAPLPHGGQLAQLQDWWQQWDDPLLPQLIEAAQRNGDTLTVAWSHIETARLESVAAGAAMTPGLDGSLESSRAKVAFFGPTMQQQSEKASLISRWELDLFGGLRRGQERAEASHAASQYRWHEARVSLAAETAHALLNARFLEQRLVLAEAERLSRRESQRLSQSLAAAGLLAPEQLALVLAAASESSAAVTALQSDYLQQIKALVALTGWQEGALREALQARAGQLPKPASFQVLGVPAQTLSQRPDVAAAERDVAAASAAIGYAKYQRFPRLQLQGVISGLRLTTDGAMFKASPWSIGANLTGPIFDGGLGAANVEAAEARYHAAEAQYRQKVRDAVKEVEQALTRLDAAGQREADVRQAQAAYSQSRAVVQGREQAGLANGLELEEAQRLALVGQVNWAAWQREQAAAWIDLYRALGGGWQADMPVSAPAARGRSKTGSAS